MIPRGYVLHLVHAPDDGDRHRDVMDHVALYIRPTRGCWEDSFTWSAIVRAVDELILRVRHRTSVTSL